MDDKHAKATREVRVQRLLPYGWILLACAAAHLWCLGSQFYMDDISQIRDNVAIPDGEFLRAKFVAWTQIWYTIQYKIFGMSVAGFHAGNWLLHTAVACVLFAFSKDFIRGKCSNGVALFGALLFAVHPLGSEIPNYARTQDLAWVTLFSLFAAWSMLLFLRQGGWELVPGEEQGQIPIFQRTHRWMKLVFCLLAITGATFSKGPGLFHALMAVGVVAMANLPADSMAVLKRRWWLLVVGMVVVFGIVWATGMLNFGTNAINQWKEPRFIGHGYTLARVFWEFAWRSLLPVGLCSDHHIAETLVPPGAGFWNIPDKGAMIAAAGMLGVAVLAAFLTWKKSTRLVGVCLALYVGTILFRVLYLIPEFMPEYRVYPGLPWFCLGAAIVLSGVWKWMFGATKPQVPAILLITVLAIMSAKRSFVWHDIQRLTDDVLRQYPAQGRAVWEMQDRDVDAGKWQAVIDRQQKVWPEVVKHFVAENGRLAPRRELPTGHFVLAEVACMGSYALAVAHQQSPAAGLREIAVLQMRMEQLKLDPVAHAIHWEYFTRNKALVLEVGGKYQAALDLLRRDNMNDAWRNDYDRIARKLAAAQP